MHGYGLSHSDGDIRPKMNRQTDTPKYAAPKYIHTSVENGDMNENVDGGSLVGFRNRIDIPEKKFVYFDLVQWVVTRKIPKFMNGMVKSTPLSRSEVIVRSVIAKSARWKYEKFTIKNVCRLSGS